MRFVSAFLGCVLLWAVSAAYGQSEGVPIDVPEQTPEFQPLKASATIEASRYIWSIEPEAAFEPKEGKEIRIWARAGKYKLSLGGGMWEKEFEVGGNGGVQLSATLTADQLEIAQGGRTTLRWTTANAAQVSIDKLPGSLQLRGSQEIGPLNADTTYTLTATGPGGSRVVALTVKVRGDSPRPQRLSIAIIEETGSRATLPAEQVKALIAKELVEYSEKNQYFLARVDKDVADVSGARPAALDDFLQAATQANVEYPALVIGVPGETTPRFVDRLPGDTAGLLATLARFGAPVPAKAPVISQTRRTFARDVEAVPADRALGCLPRTTKAGAGAFKTFEQVFTPIPREQWRTRLLSLQGYVGHIFNQGSTSSCCSNATVQSLMILRAMEHQQPVVLSPASIYGQVNDGLDRGSTLESNLSQISEVGAVPVTAIAANDWDPSGWPANWQELAKPYRVTEWFDLGGKFDNVVSAVLYGFPVVIGVDWGRGGHSICVCGVVMQQGTAHLLYVNSWGEDWENGGFGVLSEFRCRSMPRYGAWCPRSSIYTPYAAQ